MHRKAETVMAQNFDLASLYYQVNGLRGRQRDVSVFLARALDGHGGMVTPQKLAQFV